MSASDRSTPSTRRAAAQVGSWNQWRIEGDVSVPLADTAAVRAIYAHEERDSWLDFNRVNRDVLGAIVSWNVTPQLNATVGYTRQDNDADGVLWGALPLTYTDGTRIDFPVSASTSADWTYWDVTDQTAFAELSYAFGGGWQAKGVFTYKRFVEESKLLYAYGYPDRETGLGVGGMSGIYPSTYNRYLGDLYASGPVTAFGREHELAFGFSTGRSDAAEYEDFSLDPLEYPPVHDWGQVQVAEPTYPGAYLAADYSDRLTRAYGAAHLNLTDSFKAVVGVSAMWIESEGDSYGTDQSRKDSAVSPYVGAVFDLTPNVSLYASYTDIFNPQVEVDENHAKLDPAQGSSIEAGIKSEWLDKRLYATAAVFRAKQKGLAEQAGVFDNGDAYYVGVDTTSKGFELELAGRVTDHWSVSGGYTYLEIEDEQGDPTRTWLPTQTLKLATTYSVPALNDLKLGAQLRWQNAITYADPYVQDYGLVTGDVILRQEDYAVLDLMAGVRLVDRLRATVNVRNVTDTKYLASLMWGQAFYAAPRNFSLTLSFEYWRAAMAGDSILYLGRLDRSSRGGRAAPPSVGASHTVPHDQRGCLGAASGRRRRGRHGRRCLGRGRGGALRDARGLWCARGGRDPFAGAPRESLQPARRYAAGEGRAAPDRPSHRDVPADDRRRVRGFARARAGRARARRHARLERGQRQRPRALHGAGGLVGAGLRAADAANPSQPGADPVGLCRAGRSRAAEWSRRMTVAPETSTVKRALAAHAAIGLLGGALLYLVCLSGSLLVFYEEWQRFEQPTPPQMTAISPDAVQRGMEAMLAREQGKPPTTHFYVDMPLEELPTTRVITDTDAFHVDAQGNLASGERIEWSNFLYALHYTLNIPVRRWARRHHPRRHSRHVDARAVDLGRGRTSANIPRCLHLANSPQRRRGAGRLAQPAERLDLAVRPGDFAHGRGDRPLHGGCLCRCRDVLRRRRRSALRDDLRRGRQAEPGESAAAGCRHGAALHAGELSRRPHHLRHRARAGHGRAAGPDRRRASPPADLRRILHVRCPGPFHRHCGSRRWRPRAASRGIQLQPAFRQLRRAGGQDRLFRVRPCADGDLRHGDLHLARQAPPPRPRRAAPARRMARGGVGRPAALALTLVARLAFGHAVPFAAIFWIGLVAVVIACIVAASRAPAALPVEAAT